MRVFSIVALILVIPALLFSDGLANEENSQNASLSQLKMNYPGIRTYTEGDQITRVFGKPFGHGSTPL